jgi:hypothetical protein
MSQIIFPKLSNNHLASQYTHVTLDTISASDQLDIDSNYRLLELGPTNHAYDTGGLAVLTFNPTATRVQPTQRWQLTRWVPDFP